MHAEHYDVIIVGAGAAGCVLAGRLSEVPQVRVLLIEAGQDIRPDAEPVDISDPFPLSMGNPRFHWPNVYADSGVGTANGRAAGAAPFVQGFGVGGGSNINGMIGYRGLPSDYDEWRRRGAGGWGWSDVLPYFKKLERDLDFDGPLHGKDGPVPIRRIRPDDWAPFSRALGEAAMDRGFPLLADCHADFRDGVHAVPMCSLPQRRVSAASAYLPAEVRRRPNLRILSRSRAERVSIQQDRAVGVEIVGQSGHRIVGGHEVIVACGAVQSPALLMRSGIGPASSLRAFGIPVLRELPAVGRHLQNRPKIEVAVYLPRTSAQSRQQRALGQNCLRMSSALDDCPPHDMGIKFVNKTAGHAVGAHIGAVSVGLYQPFSTGSVELASRDGSLSPSIRFNALSDPRDLQRLVQGLKLALELLADKSVSARRREVFLPAVQIVRRLAQPGAASRFQAVVADQIMRFAPLRRTVLKSAMIDIHSLLSDEGALRMLVQEHASLGWHVCGSCRMGTRDNSDTVVDDECRVHGVQGLRVVDASIFPSIAGEGGMQVPVMMVAEKAADQIKREWAEPSGANAGTRAKPVDSSVVMG